MVELANLETLKEMGDNSASMVMESLSEMLCMAVEMDVSVVHVEMIKGIPDILKLPIDVVVGAYVGFSGKISGTVLTILSIESAREMADILLAGMDEDEPLEFLTEMQESAILEIGNIMTSPFIDVMADALSLELTQSPPAIACDTLSSLISLSMDGASESDFAIVFNSALHVVDQNINCNILMLPDTGNVETMINDLGSLKSTPETS
ncbi:MAG: chemotaxis protein CheC [Methanosarcinales archaeon]|nr:chemotaxis protein CheC [Methanosarcinales archaeon]